VGAVEHLVVVVNDSKPFSTAAICFEKRAKLLYDGFIGQWTRKRRRSRKRFYECCRYKKKSIRSMCCKRREDHLEMHIPGEFDS